VFIITTSLGSVNFSGLIRRVGVTAECPRRCLPLVKEVHCFRRSNLCGEREIYFVGFLSSIRVRAISFRCDRILVLFPG